MRRFQRQHGIEGSGEVDEATRVALRAVLTDSSSTREDGRSENSAGATALRATDPVACFRALDCADPLSVHDFQRSIGLPPSGDVEAETRGAMRAMRAWLAVDPLDDAAVRSFQADRDLPADGVIGDRTRSAIGDVRSDPARAASDAAASSEPDPFDGQSVRAFQRERGLADDGVIGEQTRDAILWEREHELDVDPASPAAIRAFQRSHRLREDGVLGPDTQAAMRAARSEREPADPKARSDRYGAAGGQEPLFDPADAEQIRRFQREHGLEPDGVLGEATQTAIRSVRAERRALREAHSQREDREPLAARALSLVVGFGRFWYDFVIGDDWLAAFGVVAMIAGAYGILQTAAPAFWLGPVAISTTALLTIVRALRRRAQQLQAA